MCHSLAPATVPPKARLAARTGARSPADAVSAMASASTRKLGVDGAADASMKPRALDDWAIPVLSCDGRMPERGAASLRAGEGDELKMIRNRFLV